MSTQLVVIDEGSTQGKGSWVNKDGQIENHKILSMVGEEEATDGQGNLRDCNYRIGEDEIAVATNLSETVSTKSKRYQVGIYNRAIIHELLRQAGFGGQDISVIVTLPIDQFFNGNLKDEERIEAKKKNVMGDIQSMTKQPLANIVNCTVAPESIPAWYNVLINEKGEVNEKYASASYVLVTDIGGTTVDLTLIDGQGNPIKRATIQIGVLDIIDRLMPILAQEENIKSVQKAHYDQMLRTRTYRGKDISAHIQKAARPVRNQILAKMDEFVADPDSLDHQVYSGGGAALIGDSLDSKFGSSSLTHISDDPDMDIATGMTKLRIMQQLAAGATA